MTSSHSRLALATATRALDRSSLDEIAQQVQSGLAGSVGPGTPLGLWLDDPIDFATCAMAALASRAEAFVIAPGTTPERARMLCSSERASAILCDSRRAAQLRQGSHRMCGADLVLVETGQPSKLNDHDQGALHFYTSGTDGTPKGVVRTRASLELEEQTVGDHLGMGSGCKVLCAVPITHGYGYTAGVFAPISVGGSSMVAQPKMAASLARMLQEYEPDIVVGVPAQYAAWAALRRPYTGPLPRLFMCGGAPLPQAVRARFKAAWGTVIAEQYGMTEVGAVTVDIDGTETLGRPYPGVTVEIADARVTGDVGEVVVRAPYAPQGYIGDPAAARFTARGFRSGDTGWFDPDGRLHIVGRRSHQLNVRGQKVDPAEVERAIWSVEGVQDVAVVGVDRASGDQWIAAFVACSEATTEDAIRQATTRLEPYKRPQRVFPMSRLPVNGTGKTDFEALRAMTRTSR